MDSKAYRYLAERIHPSVLDVSAMPLALAHAPAHCTPEVRSALSAFLDSFHQHDIERLPMPPLLMGDAPGPLGSLIRFVHRSLGQSLGAGSDEIDRTAKAAGAQLVELLADSQQLRATPLLASGDCLSGVLLCFLLEASMHMGWCPNTAEGRVKRAAHQFFARAKKYLYSASTDEMATLFCYLWGAWLLAQMTEGIREGRLSVERGQVLRSFRWQRENESSALTLLNYPSCFAFTMTSASDSVLPSAFSLAGNEGCTGYRVETSHGPLSPSSLLSVEEIHRPHTEGFRFCHSCDVPGGRILWTTVIQLHRHTLYRIDALQAQGVPVVARVIDYRQETLADLLSVAPDRYAGHPGKKDFLVLEILKNPAGLVLEGMDQPGIARFHSTRAMTIFPEQTQEIVVAWRSGKSELEIERTHLTGIYER